MANVQVTQDLNVKRGRLQVLVNRLNSGGLQYHEIQEAIQILKYFAELAELRRNCLHTSAIVRILRQWNRSTDGVPGKFVFLLQQGSKVLEVDDPSGQIERSCENLTLIMICSLPHI